MKKFLPIFLLLGIMASMATAGTTDSLGTQGLWNTVSSWLTDGYATKILALIFFAVGVWRAFAGSILQFFLMLGFAVLITQGVNIINAINTATF